MTLDSVSVAGQLPRIYLACPLTNLTADRRRVLTSEVSQVRMSIESATVDDRVSDEAWPVAIYAPIDATAPWGNDGLSASAIYERNFSEVLDADALIVLADIAASAGVGQEVEWACRLGIPVLYLTPSPGASRQIQGIAGAITCAAYSFDASTLSAIVTNFLRQNRLRILDGPRRRESRRLRFEALTARLRIAWQSCSDPTGVAARCALSPVFVPLMLADPGRVAVMSVDSLMMLAAELGVPLSTAPGLQLPVASMRALVLAAAEDAWDDRTVERLRLHGLAAISADPELDLATLDAWRTLYRAL